MDHEKYKALYEYQKDQFASENERFHRLEDKAVKYLTSITVAVSAYILLVRWCTDKIIPPSGLLDWLVVVSIVLTITSMALSWSYIFRSIKLQDLMKMPVGEKVSELFHENERATVYLSLSRRYSEAAKEKERQYNLKLKNVRKGYSKIVFSGWCFLISITLIFANVWAGGLTMSDNDRNNETQTTNERPPDVEAPELVPVMEGYTEQGDKFKHKES